MLVAIALLVAGAIVLTAVAILRLRNARVREPAARTDWTDDAGLEFAGLPEAARCDLVFAFAALNDRRAQNLLERALDDPCEPVALAAAHALATHGSRARLERYLAANPGERTARIASTLALLAEDP